MSADKRQQILEDELLMVRHSGEMPEVAYHASLYYLCDDPEGPKLSLSEEEQQQLMKAAQEQYLEIIYRDLNPDNRDLSLYRGIERSFVNWQRLTRFCTRLNQDWHKFRGPVGNALTAFLCLECEEVLSGKAISKLNCTHRELCLFLDELDLDRDTLLDQVENSCVFTGKGSASQSRY